MTDHPDSGYDELSFDRAIPITGGSAPAGAPAVNCSICMHPIAGTYHTANHEPVCDACRQVVDSLGAPVRQPALLAKALVFGVGASLVGAVIYWAVIKFFKLEIGLVAVLTGWMVGKAVRQGADGRGGRILQLGSAFLTYYSVGLAYLPFTLQDGGELGVSSLLVALLLPVYVIVGSFPSGLISAVIIGFGMMQAWQLTGTPRIVFQGPFRVGGASAGGADAGSPSVG